MATNLQRNENLAAIETLNKPIDWKKALGSILGGMAVVLILIGVLIICGDSGKRKRKKKRQKFEKPSYELSGSSITWPDASAFSSEEKKKKKKKKKKRKKRRKQKTDDYLDGVTDQEGWRWSFENGEEAEPEIKEQEEAEAEAEDEAEAEAEAEEEAQEEESEVPKKKKKKAKKRKDKKQKSDLSTTRYSKSRIASSLNAMVKEILLQYLPLTQGYGQRNYPMYQGLNKTSTADKELIAPQIVLPLVSPQQQFLEKPLIIPSKQQQLQQQQLQQQQLQQQQLQQQQLQQQFRQSPKPTPRLAPQLSPSSPTPPPPQPPQPPPAMVFQSPRIRGGADYQLKKSPKLYQDKKQWAVPTPVAPPIPLKQYEIGNQPSRKTRKNTSELGDFEKSSISEDYKSKIRSHSSSKKNIPFYAQWKPGGSSIYGPDTGTPSDSSTIMAKMNKSQSSRFSSLSTSVSEMDDPKQKSSRKFKNKNYLNKDDVQYPY